MKKISLTILSMAMIFVVMGQQVPTSNNTTPISPIIKFESTTFDFATIKEEKGVATCVFKFKNIGKQEVQVLSVRPSCGCSTTEYTKESIKPGGSGVVKVTYDPANRPGVFNKSIAVTTNDPAAPNVTLFIKGNVLPKPKTKEQLFPVQQGNLRFLTNHLSFNLTDNETKVDTLKVYNAGKTKIELKFINLPKFVTVLSPAVMKVDAGAESKIIVKYEAAKRNEIGFVYDKFTINTNDSTQLEKIVYLSANISEDFSKLTPEQLANAPMLSIDKEEFDFGRVLVGEVVDHYYVLKNEGKTKLVIRKVKASCGCTATQPEQMEIDPGQSTRIKASFNSAGRVGQQHKTITVITNDPKRSNITLTIKGEVYKEDAIEIKGDTQKGEGSGTMYKIK